MKLNSLLFTNLFAFVTIIILFFSGIIIEKIFLKKKALFSTNKIVYSALSCTFYVVLNVVIIWLGKLVFFSMITIQIAQSFFLIFGLFFGISLGIIVAIISDIICFLLTTNIFGFHFGFSLDIVLFAFCGGMHQLFKYFNEKSLKSSLIVFNILLVLLIKLGLDRIYLSALYKVNMFVWWLMVHETIITLLEIPFYIFFFLITFNVFKARFSLNFLKKKNSFKKKKFFLLPYLQNVIK